MQTEIIPVSEGECCFPSLSYLTSSAILQTGGSVSTRIRAELGQLILLMGQLIPRSEVTFLKDILRTSHEL